MTIDVTKNLFFPFYQVHHRAGDGLLAFECSHTWAFPEGHSALINIGHLRRLNRFVAAIVIEHQQTLVGDNFVFIEELFGAGKIPVGVDVFDVDLSLAGILIFRQQILNVRGNWRARRKENRDAHLAFERIEETLRFIGERIFLVTG